MKPLPYLLVVLMLLAGSCNDPSVMDAMKWRVTLSSEDKNPYGAYLAYHSLQYFFPEAQVKTLSKEFRLNNMSNEMRYSFAGHSLLVLEGLTFHLSGEEWKDLKQFIKNGNEVVLFCSTLDEKIERELSCYKLSGVEGISFLYQDKKDFDNKGALTLTGDSAKAYGYEGRTLKGYFSIKDNTVTSDSTAQDTTADGQQYQPDEDIETSPDTLGMVYEKPDFVRFRIGTGHLTLHAAPLVLSNYFLLQPDNINYLTGIWKTLPENISKVYWTGYLYRTVQSSSMDILWRYPATRWALLLGLLALLVYVLFEGKRKQRIIPEIPPVRNDSVSFVETVGRLYYNKGNHTNLAEKMVQQFLEWVRAHYFLNTNLINEQFIHQLTIKSGQPEAMVRAVTDMAEEVRRGSALVDEAYLYQLYNTIQQFYKNNPA